MADLYNRNTWVPGGDPPISATNLNNIEKGIVSGAIESKGVSLDLDYYFNNNVKSISTGHDNDSWENEDWAGNGGAVADYSASCIVKNKAYAITASSQNHGAHLVKTLNLYQSNDTNVLSQSYFSFYMYIDSTSFANLETNGIKIVLANDAFETQTNYLYYDLPKASIIGADAWYHYAIDLNNFTAVGTGSRSAITGLSFSLVDAPSGAVTFVIDGIQAVRSDFSSEMPNPFQVGQQYGYNSNILTLTSQSSTMRTVFNVFKVNGIASLCCNRGADDTTNSTVIYPPALFDQTFSDFFEVCFSTTTGEGSSVCLVNSDNTKFVRVVFNASNKVTLQTFDATSAASNYYESVFEDLLSDRFYKITKRSDTVILEMSTASGEKKVLTSVEIGFAVETTWKVGIYASGDGSTPPTNQLLSLQASRTSVATKAHEASIAHGLSNRALVQISKKNHIIDGNFQVAQAYAGVGTELTDPATNTYPVFDMYKIAYSADSGTLPTIKHSQQLITSGAVFGSKYCYRINTDGSGTSLGTLSYYHIVQNIENGVQRLWGDGKKITLSFCARSTISNKKLGFKINAVYGTGGSPSSTETINGSFVTLTSTWTKYTHTFTANTLSGKTFGTNNDDYIQCVFGLMYGSGASGAVTFGDIVAETFVGSGDIEIAQIKIETGDVATPFVPLLYQTELLKAQEYIYVYNLDDQYSAVGNGVAKTTTVANIIVQFPTKMRINPNLLSVTAGDFGLGGSGYGVTVCTNIALTGSQGSKTHATLGCTVASGLTAGNPYQLLGSGTAGKKIIFDARLG